MVLFTKSFEKRLKSVKLKNKERTKKEQPKNKSD